VSGGGTGKLLHIDPWPGEPPRLTIDHVDELLMYCVKNQSSDISLQTDRPAYGEIHGHLYPLTAKPLDPADLNTIMTKLYGLDAAAKLAAAKDLDLSYEIRLDRFTKVRFRVNITAIQTKGRDGASITMRVMPNQPPTMKDLGIEQEIIDNFSPRQGLICVTGPTGSGKSTLLAAGMRMLIEREGGCGKMLTYEAPIEYTYDAITNPQSLVSQTEIPRHLPNFAAGVRNALRRKPAIILVGESRDRETVAASIEAGQTGHAVYTTAHTMGVSSTLRRLVSVFEPGERNERAGALMETLRMIITQALVPRATGGRIALREFMVFDDVVREELLDMPQERWSNRVQQMLPDRGQTIQKAAKIAFESGQIDRKYYLILARGSAD
jgi:defect in organelle trafficking protein DotB